MAGTFMKRQGKAGGIRACSPVFVNVVRVFVAVLDVLRLRLRHSSPRQPANKGNLPQTTSKTDRATGVHYIPINPQTHNTRIACLDNGKTGKLKGMVPL